MEGSEINLRFVFRYKTLVQQSTPPPARSRLAGKSWPKNAPPIQEAPRNATRSLKLLAEGIERKHQGGGKLAIRRAERGRDWSKRVVADCGRVIYRGEMSSLSISTLLAPPADALEAITADTMLAHIEVLSSDDFGGRAPGSRGEELSVRYLTDQFKALGLKPGNPDGTFVQEVPLAGLRPAPTLSLDLGQGPTRLRYPQDFVASTARLVPEVSVENSEIVFVGYGIVAPEYGWDDYKDVDVRGKTILMLINDPVLPDPEDPSRPDETMFKGRAMTHYGRWTYKYQIAASKGAAAAIIIHETGPAGYPYSVVATSWQREIYELDAPDRNLGAVAVRSWITLDVAKSLLAGCGQDFDRLKEGAQSKAFRPVALGTEAGFEVKSELRLFKSRNVLARLEGSDPARCDQCIVYSAHWDHLGRREEPDGEPRIFRGAIDNASGVAALIELARAYMTLEPAPKCSVLFLSPTVEESGLLGARYYAAHPVYPLAKTLANINIDGVNPWGKTRDIENICAGNSTLDDLFAALARRPRPDRAAADAARERLPLSSGPLRIFQGRRALHLPERRQGSPRPATGIRSAEKRGVHPMPLPPAVRQDRPGVGPRRSGARYSVAVRTGIPDRGGRPLAGVETDRRIQGQTRRDAGDASDLDGRNLKATGGRGRTDTPLREQDFESSASANFATPAWIAGTFS